MLDTASTAHQAWGHPQAQDCTTGNQAMQHEKIWVLATGSLPLSKRSYSWPIKPIGSHSHLPPVARVRACRARSVCDASSLNRIIAKPCCEAGRAEQVYWYCKTVNTHFTAFMADQSGDDSIILHVL